MNKRKRFEIVHNIASPYRVYMFSEMHRQLEAKGIDFHVHFMSDMSRGYSDRPLSWRNPKMDFPHTYWRDWGYSHYAFNPGMIWHLLMHRPDWMLVGSCYDTITGALAALLCSVKDSKTCWLEGNTKTPNKLRGLVARYKHLIMSKFKYVGVPGSDAIKFIALHQDNSCLRMPKPILLPNIVDETRFKPRDAWPATEIEEQRRKLGVAVNEKLALTPARLEPVKGLIPYLSSLEPSMLQGWKLVIMGMGSLHDEVVSVIKVRGLEKCVSILDYIPYDEMPRVYAASDLFVLPSVFDPNPLSVVEALHSGLPVAVSDQAGNVEDAVAPGKNGWILPVRNPEDVKKSLSDMFSCPLEKLKEFGAYSRNVQAGFWNTHDAIQRFLHGIGCV